MMPAYDVITFGEALLRLTPPAHARYEQSPLLERHIGGSELNTAVGLARLGLRVAWLSRLTADAIGRLIAREGAVQGVSTDHIIWTDTERTGIYYMEEARPPRPSQVTYDRAHSAMSAIQPDDLPDTLPACRILHVSGITPALSDAAYQTSLALLERAQQAQIPLSFDVNYRAKLWSVAQAAERCQPFMRSADILLIAERDAQRLFDASDLGALSQQYPDKLIVMTRGAQGAQAITPDGQRFEQPIFPAETVCRIGGGDAFSAGFLYAYLADQPVADALRFAAAAAAIKYTLAGDLPLFDLAQIEAVLNAHGDNRVDR